MQVFLDTQILLNYLKGNADEKAFPILNNLLKDKKIVSFVTTQVIDEYFRNIAKVKNEKMKNIEVPYSINCNSLKTFNQEVKRVRKSVEKRIENIKKEKNYFKIREENIKYFFENSEILKDDPEILKKAEIRYLKGNPPRKQTEKNNSYGDAINWELLLKNSNKKDKLFIVSLDSDYSEELYGKIGINSFLHKEWRGISRRKIKLFTTLSEFINDFTGKKVIKQETIDTEKESIKEEEILQTSQDELLIHRNQKLKQLRDYVKGAVSMLSPREQKIIEMRFGLIDGVPHTLNEVGQEFDVSRQRIRQIETRALAKIRNFKVHNLNDF
jgi:RNA polymerase sigma factor (sigma-70 family)